MNMPQSTKPYNMFDEEFPEETPLEPSDESEEIPEKEKHYKLKPTTYDLLGRNKLVNNSPDVIIARSAALLADLSSIGLGMIGAFPGAASSDIAATMLNLYADIRDTSLSTEETVRNALLNSFTSLSSLIPVVGTGLDSASSMIKAAKRTVEISQILLSTYALIMTPQQFELATNALKQIKMMVYGLVEFNLNDFLRSLKEILMLFASLQSVLKQRVSAYDNTAKYFKKSDSESLRKLGDIMSDNPVWKGVNAIRSTINKPSKEMEKNLKRSLFGTDSEELIRIKAARDFDENPNLKNKFLTYIYGEAEPKGIDKLLGLDPVPLKDDLISLEILQKMSSKLMAKNNKINEVLLEKGLPFPKLKLNKSGSYKLLNNKSYETISDIETIKQQVLSKLDDKDDIARLIKFLNNKLANIEAGKRVTKDTLDLSYIDNLLNSSALYNPKLTKDQLDEQRELLRNIFLKLNAV